MTVDLSPIDESLLAEIAGLHGMPKGAFNIRRDGQLVERHNSAFIEISTKTDVPGIDIHIAPGTKGETVYIPVIVTQSGLKDVVYNTFYIGEDCDAEDSWPVAVSTIPATRPPSTMASTASTWARTVEFPMWKSTMAKGRAPASAS